MKVPIHKAGDKKDCDNKRDYIDYIMYEDTRAITLIKKIKAGLGKTSSESQSGFRKIRSIQAHIFGLKQIKENNHDHNIPI